MFRYAMSIQRFTNALNAPIVEIVSDRLLYNRGSLIAILLRQLLGSESDHVGCRPLRDAVAARSAICRKGPRVIVVDVTAGASAPRMPATGDFPSHRGRESLLALGM